MTEQNPHQPTAGYRAQGPPQGSGYQGATPTGDPQRGQPPSPRPAGPASPPSQWADRGGAQHSPASQREQIGYRVPAPPPVSTGSGGGRRRPNFATVLLTSILSLVFLFFVAICGLLAAYVAIASDLPSPDSLRGRTATFVSTRIYDRDGHLLYEIFDPNGGRRTLVPYEQISPYLIHATVATEDSRFWQHPGVDPIGILRAAFYNVQEKTIVSGASTIPQQLARLVLMSPEERTEISYRRKIREAVLASEISRRYSKQEILEIYVNEINYGSLAYGIGAASDTFFGKSPADLTLAEAALLAGLPQAPAYWDPYSDLAKAKTRQAVVLDLMAEEGYISQSEADAAKLEPLDLQPLSFDVEAPHFVIWVQQLLEQKYGVEVLYRSGLQVYTTLDWDLQALAEQEAQAHLATLRDRHATNASVVALKPGTGEILAMLGSADFYNAEIDGQVNVSLQLRQPGSSIKPVTYVTAFEKGWTPSTLIWDVTTEFKDGLGRSYVPKNYDGKEHGPVRVREALAQSLNIPAVKALDFVGLPAMLDTARRLGIESLNRPDYGLSLTLGGGDVTLLEMTGAYAVFANGGKRVPPVAILRIHDAAGNLLEEYQPPAGEQVISPQHAYLITDILSDNAARAPIFGRDNALKLSRPAAAKTGTTDDYHDSWTVGYTPELVIGVWVGNADNTEMVGVTGSRGAAPIWHNVMEKALADQPASQFARPEGIEEIVISADAGSLPSEVCPADRRRTEIFATGQGPLGPEFDFHQLVRIDRTTGARATEYCPADVIEERYFYVLPGPEGQKWAQDRGIPQPPSELCPVHTGPAQVALFQPLPGETVQEEVYVVGRANRPDFDHYIVEYGEGQDPLGWGLVAGPVYAPVDGGLLAVWDIRSLADRDYTLRVVVYDHLGNGIEARTWVWVQNPTPTWTPTPTLTPTPGATATLPPTLTPWPTETPRPTDTPWPTDTPRPTETPRPTNTPKPTKTPWPSPTSEPTWTPLPTLTLPPTLTPGPTLLPIPTITLTQVVTP